MSLVSRLSGFFLAALAAVLVGFSATLYLLAADHLHRQVDERLDAALATLAAAAEVGPGGVEWEPGERSLGLGRDTGPDQIRWIVRDVRGRMVDRSANFNSSRLSPGALADPGHGSIRDHHDTAWRTKSRSVILAGLVNPSAGDDIPVPPAAVGEDHPGARHAALTFVVFAPRGPTEATLTRLAVILTLLSTALWALSAFAGRALCRRALVPLTRMATAARAADAADPSTRLPVAGTKDALDDLGHAFNGLLDRLHEALERQRRFTGDASHQLRTPLTGLLSHVDVALRHERPPGEYRRVLEVVRAKGAQLRQIIESLLFLARTESDSQHPTLEAVDLTGWVPEHLASWTTHSRAEDIQLACEAGGPLRINAHPPLLSQLLDNLLENACKYSRPGTPVVIGMRRASGFALLTVEDQGHGLSTEEQSRVFQPFYRSPQARGQSGVGLGLAVAHRIVSVFGGRIRVESEPGIGTRFEISLPEAEALKAVPADSPVENHVLG